MHLSQRGALSSTRRSAPWDSGTINNTSISRQPWAVTPASAHTAVDHLVMTVDGFNAAKATATYPPLTQLSQESVKPALGVVQDILPARILGTILTQHPQLLAVDLTSWVEFLTAFGFDQPAIQELLRSSPEAFYKSNVFQVWLPPPLR